MTYELKTIEWTRDYLVYDRSDGTTLLGELTQTFTDNQEIINGEVVSSVVCISVTTGTSKGFVHSRYSKALNSVSLISGPLFLDLPGFYGQRITTLNLYTLVEWAQQWPSLAEVGPIHAYKTTNDMSDENVIRRNQAYESIGFQFKWVDPDTKDEGRSTVMSVSNLNLNKSWKLNIKTKNELMTQL